MSNFTTGKGPTSEVSDVQTQASHVFCQRRWRSETFGSVETSEEKLQAQYVSFSSSL
jgi:hypothetical protein